MSKHILQVRIESENGVSISSSTFQGDGRISIKVDGVEIFQKTIENKK